MDLLSQGFLTRGVRLLCSSVMGVLEVLGVEGPLVQGDSEDMDGVAADDEGASTEVDVGPLTLELLGLLISCRRRCI